MTHKVRIRWGQQPEPGEFSEYMFATQAELDAFLLGVDEASGWLEYDLIEQNADGTWPEMEEEEEEA